MHNVTYSGVNMFNLHIKQTEISQERSKETKQKLLRCHFKCSFKYDKLNFRFINTLNRFCIALISSCFYLDVGFSFLFKSVSIWLQDCLQVVDTIKPDYQNAVRCGEEALVNDTCPDWEKSQVNDDMELLKRTWKEVLESVVEEQKR